MAIQQEVIVDVNKAIKSLRALEKKFKDVDGKGVKPARKGLNGFVKAGLVGLGALAAYRFAGGVVSQFRKMVTAGLEFQKTIAEIETLMPQAERHTQRLTKSLIGLSNAYGQDVQAQARGFYDIVSAGVQGFEKQLEVLNVTNKVAIGGVTDTATATNLLVTTMNAFESQGATAESVADVLFTTVKQGVTTIGQLASSLGNVNAIASTSGVELKEVGASMAVLTKNGLGTAEASTALRSAIVSFSKPTKEAQGIVKRLGIDFSTTAIQQKGFYNVLKQVRTATNGNIATLQKLFPNVRAQAALLPILTTRWDEFERQMRNFNNTSGATNQAFKRVTDTGAFQLSKFTTGFENLYTQISSALDLDVGGFFKTLSTSIVENEKLVKGIARAFGLFNIIVLNLIAVLIDFFNLFIKGTAKAISFAGKLTGIKFFKDFGDGVQGAADAISGISTAIADFGTMSFRSLNEFADNYKGTLKKLQKDIKTIDLTPKTAADGEDAGDKVATQAKKVIDAGFKFRTAGDLFEKSSEKQNIAVEDLASQGLKAATQLFGENKALLIAEAIANTYAGATRALATINPPASFVAAATIVATGLANVAKIRQQDSGGYQQGGIIPGNQFEGDRVVARVNSGEMILNRSQQKNLFNMIERGSGGGGANVTINIQSLTGDIPRRSLDNMIDQIRQRVEFGNKRFV